MELDGTTIGHEHTNPLYDTHKNGIDSTDG